MDGDKKVFDSRLILLDMESEKTYWNEIINSQEYPIVALDIFGGLFGLCEKTSTITYFAPDTLEWENFEVTYPQFIEWLSEGDIDNFYESFMWENWEQEVKQLNFDEGISFYPPLWAKSEQERNRKAISLKEIISFSFDMKQKLGII